MGAGGDPREDAAGERMTSTEQKMKRLPFDLPESLHPAIKLRAGAAGVTIVDMLRTLLEKHYGGVGP